jgi:metal-sulfur cluster biosynthetic enzyme
MTLMGCTITRCWRDPMLGERSEDGRERVRWMRGVRVEMEAAQAAAACEASSGWRRARVT